MSNIYLEMPTTAQPTEVLASRFASWRKIIRGLNLYFKEVASVQDEVVRQNVRLGHTINFPFFQFGTAETASTQPIITSDANTEIVAAETTQVIGEEYASSVRLHPEDELTKRMFLPYGSQSISDVPANIIAFHRAQALAASRASKDLVQVIIPRLEDLRRDLLVKLKEIKNLSSDFKNSVDREQAASEKELTNYVNSINTLATNPSLLPPRNDPYLLKFAVDRQLHRQVNEENYLLEAFLNLEHSGNELEKVVVQEIQQALSAFGKLMGTEGANYTDLLSNKILNGFVSKDPSFEWDSFIQHDPNFVDPNLKLRKIHDINYPKQKSPLIHPIRSGYLERRSKYLKSYSRAYYVLTPSFLHEFKSPDRKKDPNPVMSLSLDDCQLSSDTSSKSSSHKFILNAKQSSSSGASTHGHNWVFRAESAEKLTEWFNELQKLIELKTPLQRALHFFPEEVEKPADAEVSKEVNGVNPAGEEADETAATAEDSTGIVAAATAGAAIGTAAVGANLAVRTSGSINRGIASPSSDTSFATSTGEPFAAPEDDEEISAVSPVVEKHTNEARGRFPSDLNLEPSSAADAAAATAISPIQSRAFVLPSEIDTSAAVVDDNESVFSYDLRKDTNSTLPQDKDFKPVDADVPVHVERRLTMTKHKEEFDPTGGIGVARDPQEFDKPTEDVLSKRRDSVVSNQGRKPPSRRATGSFGTDTDGLKPLSSIEPKPDQNSPEPFAAPSAPLFFATGLPSTTSGAEGIAPDEIHSPELAAENVTQV